MRIAMLAPINWPLPPDGYGPWEQVAHNLTEELVRLGHDVTLFAAGGSKSSAKLVETWEDVIEELPTPIRSEEVGFDRSFFSHTPSPTFSDVGLSQDVAFEHQALDVGNVR